MKTFGYRIKTPVGIHARPAAELSHFATGFACQLRIRKGAREVNVKHIMQLLALNVCQGDEVTFILDGVDENEAYPALVDFCTKNL